MKYTMRSIAVMVMLFGSVQILTATKKHPRFYQMDKSKDGTYQIGFEKNIMSPGKKDPFKVNVWRSANSGKTWKLLSGKRKSGLPVFTTTWLGMMMSTEDNGKYQAMVASNDYVYVSHTFGKTWKRVKQLPRADWASVGVFPMGDRMQVAYWYKTAKGKKDMISYVSGDYGKTWKVELPVLPKHRKTK